MVVALRLLERGPVPKAADRLVRAVLEQLRDDGGVALLRRDVEWRAIVVRLSLVDEGAGCDELRHHGEVALLRRDEEWGAAVGRPRLVDVGAGCDELRHHGEVAVLRREVEWGGAVVVIALLTSAPAAMSFVTTARPFSTAIKSGVQPLIVFALLTSAPAAMSFVITVRSAFCAAM